MPKKQITVDFSEIFNFAEENYNVGWNECCDIFHRKELIIGGDGDTTKNISLGEIERELTYNERHPDDKYKHSVDKLKGYEILIAFMKKYKLKEMLVLND